MSAEGPSRSRGAGPGRVLAYTRKLNLPSRLRFSSRRAVEGLLAADAAWSAAFIVGVVLLLGTARCGPSAGALTVGQPAPLSLKSPAGFELTDEAETARRREAAAKAVPLVCIFDPERGAELVSEIQQFFDSGRTAIQEAARVGADPAGLVAEHVGEPLPAEALPVLLELQFGVDYERELTAAVLQVLAGKVVANKSRLERERQITLQYGTGGREQVVENFDDFIDLAEARRQVEATLAKRLKLPAAQRRAIVGVALAFVDANVQPDANATEERRRLAAAEEPPVLVRVERGEVLVRRGERVTAATLERVEAVARAARRGTGARELLALLFVGSMLAFFLLRYARHHQRAFKKLPHLHSLMVLMLLSMLVLTRGVMWVAGKIVDGLEPPFSDLNSYAYLVPLGAGAILVALLANGRIATVYSAFAALLFGVAEDWDPYLMVWALLVQCAGVYATSTYKERAALLRSGFVVGGAAALTALAIETLRDSGGPLSGVLYAVGLAFVGGALGVGLLISFSLPLLERLFNVLTDIRLLELSNVNNPLLSALALKAPGSYNHSLVVGQLAEEAARAIGANSLFCRVAAFYHDIGKMNKPEYYVENQRGDNPHDRLSPSMSALIIASHVKDGIKLAREAGLPEQIVDIIPQHHGTKLMHYFYEKAKSESDPALGLVKKEDFRYPGPKPQTREAAIFMLADAVEAAARTVEEPAPNRLREMIRKVTSAIVLDRELDSCDLTFADLEKIQEAFLKCLTGMYHHRVDYPGFDFGKPRGEGRFRGRTKEDRGEPAPGGAAGDAAGGG